MEVKNYFEIYKEVWSFHKSHSAVRNDTQYWDTLVEEMNDLCVRYGRDPFVVELCLAVLSELERVAKRIKSQEEERNV